MSLRVGSLCGVPCAIGTFVIGALSLATPASAGPIAIDTYYEFGFDDVGTLATGCDPVDPAGAFCLSNSVPPTTLLDAPPWTFTSGATGSTLTVTDAFLSGDRFQIFDFGVSLGFTSAFVLGGDCGDDPVSCLADLDMSHGAFGFASGAHSITIGVAEGGFGSAYLLLQDGGTPAVPAVPEPAPLLLLGTGLGVMLYRRRHRPETHRASGYRR